MITYIWINLFLFLSCGTVDKSTLCIEKKSCSQYVKTTDDKWGVIDNQQSMNSL